MDSTLNWLTLHLTPGLGPAGLRALLGMYDGDPAKILSASAQELNSIKGLKPGVVEGLTNKATAKRAHEELTKASQQRVHILCREDEHYPHLLEEIYNPPTVLYVKGAVELLNDPAIAIVGSRAATSYGLKIASRLSFDLAKKAAIVSGLALGIDSAAHQGALDSRGKTIAVLGCGLDIIYPRQNAKLARHIIESGGAIVSEYPFGTKPDAFRFPARNRIISGMSLGVLVVEAADRSGSLITARHSLEEGREVFAIPGRVDSVKSTGTHRLLKDGAKLVNGADDILEEFPFLVSRGQNTGTRSKETEPETNTLSECEKKILNVLDSYPKHIDSIMDETSLDIAQLNESLLLLELKGAIEALPGQQYSKIA